MNINFFLLRHDYSTLGTCPLYLHTYGATKTAHRCKYTPPELRSLVYFGLCRKSAWLLVRTDLIPGCTNAALANTPVSTKATHHYRKCTVSVLAVASIDFPGFESTLQRTAVSFLRFFFLYFFAILNCANTSRMAGFFLGQRLGGCKRAQSGPQRKSCITIGWYFTL